MLVCAQQGKNPSTLNGKEDILYCKGQKKESLHWELQYLLFLPYLLCPAPSEQDDILVFSEDGGMVSQEEQTVEIVVEDNLKGDSRAKGQQVVDYASQFIGRPYRYGGLSLLHGSDCSGFLVGVFGHFGISLPHSSGAIRSVGTSVGSLENALPGDILAYSGHVGIYLGEGRMLSALNSRSGVTIESATYKPIKSIRRLF